MSTERHIELIHGEIDGTNSPDESSELRRILERDAGAREFHAEMKQLAGVLNCVEEAEVPEGLRESIQATIASRQNVTAPLPFLRNTSHVRTFTRASGLRLAVALAAGLVLGLVVGPRISKDATGWNPADFGGSMMPETAMEIVTDRLELDVDRLSGTVRVTHGEDRTLVSLDISAQAPVELALGYDSDKVRFKGFARQEGEFDAVEARDGRISVSGDGDLRYTVLLERLNPAETTLRLEYRRDAALLGETIMKLDAVN